VDVLRHSFKDAWKASKHICCDSFVLSCPNQGRWCNPVRGIAYYYIRVHNIDIIAHKYVLHVFINDNCSLPLSLLFSLFLPFSFSPFQVSRLSLLYELYNLKIDAVICILIVRILLFLNDLFIKRYRSSRLRQLRLYRPRSVKRWPITPSSWRNMSVIRMPVPWSSWSMNLVTSTSSKLMLGYKSSIQ